MLGHAGRTETNYSPTAAMSHKLLYWGDEDEKMKMKTPSAELGLNQALDND